MLVAALTVVIGVGWVAVYFWIADRREAREAHRERFEQDVQAVDVLVNGGYHPARTTAVAGRPVRLRITRVGDGEEWWDDFEFPYQRLVRWLPEEETITVDVGRLDPGEYALFCANGTMRGTLVVEETPGSR